jgi:hypothetical protein
MADDWKITKERMDDTANNVYVCLHDKVLFIHDVINRKANIINHMIAF